MEEQNQFRQNRNNVMMVNSLQDSILETFKTCKNTDVFERILKSAYNEKHEDPEKLQEYYEQLMYHFKNIPVKNQRDFEAFETIMDISFRFETEMHQTDLEAMECLKVKIQVHTLNSLYSEHYTVLKN